MQRGFYLAGLCLVIGACRGTVPASNGYPERGIASLIISGRIILPTGETRDGELSINLEGEGGREAQVYRLPIVPQQSSFFQVEPGTYHLAPTRSWLGLHGSMLKVEVEGRTYSVEFPRELMRKAAIVVKPTAIVPIGILQARFTAALPGREPEVRVSLDDSVSARRRIVEGLIRTMMDPGAPADIRDSAVAWTRGLQQTLVDLQSESARSPLYKPALP